MTKVLANGKRGKRGNLAGEKSFVRRIWLRASEGSLKLNDNLIDTKNFLVKFKIKNYTMY